MLELSISWLALTNWLDWRHLALVFYDLSSFTPNYRVMEASPNLHFC